MKKILSIFLATLFCISTFAGLGITSFAEGIADNLVVHYDFEGSTTEEKLKDKATGGSASDDMSIMLSETAMGIEFADGAITHKDVGLEKGQRTFLKRVVAEDDITAAMNGDITFISRFKMDSKVIDAAIANDGFVYITDMGTGSASKRPFCMMYQISSKRLYVAYQTTNDSSCTYAYVDLPDYDFTNSPWITFVVTIGKASDNGWDVKLRYKLDNSTSTDWTTAEAEANKRNVGEDRRTLLTGEFTRIFGQSSAVGLTIDDIKLYNKALTDAEINSVVGNSGSSTPTQPTQSDAKTVAYTVGDKFVEFIQADDTKHVVINDTAKWSVKDFAGAMGGKALHCSTKATDALSGGFSVTFSVPKAGNYAVWGRVYYADQGSNSMHYSVDGGASQIWDLVDDVQSDAYGKWHYFYLTDRVAGTYTDTTKYGEWTIANNQHRHAANTLTLTEGEHTIMISGREPGMYIDEIVITSYSYDEYDPNEFQGNTAILDKCQFCGTNVKHYISDLYAQQGISAQTYFKETLHKDAVEWTIPDATLPEPPQGGDQPQDPPTIDPPSQFEPDDGDDTDPADTTPADTTPTDTGAPSDTQAEEKSGCGSNLGISAFAVLAVISLAGVVVAKRKIRD